MRGGRGGARGGGSFASGGLAGGLEKRKDTDGKFYSKLEFKNLYGGYREWDAAGGAGAGMPPTAMGQQMEKRRDTDGKLYSKAEFKALYGGYKEWDAAGGAGGGAWPAGSMEKRKDTDGKWYTKAEFKNLYGGYVQWDAAAGAAGGKGAAAGKGGAGEKRHDTDGGLYTKAEFKALYGGYAEWDAAAPQVATRGGRGGATAGRGGRGGFAGAVVMAEKRRDTDGQYYSKAEFKELYGGYAEWDAAAGGKGGRGGFGGRGAGGATGGVEKRKDSDGKFYTKQDFKKLYGGYSEWDAAAATARSAPFRTGKGGFNDVSVGVKEKRAAAAREGRSMIVGNLPYSVKWRDLKDLASKHGTVTGCDIFMEGPGRSKGIGIVVFEQAAAASAFKDAMDQKELQGRTVHIRPDEKLGLSAASAKPSA